MLAISAPTLPTAAPRELLDEAVPTEEIAVDSETTLAVFATELDHLLPQVGQVPEIASQEQPGTPSPLGNTETSMVSDASVVDASSKSSTTSIQPGAGEAMAGSQREGIDAAAAPQAPRFAASGLDLLTTDGGPTSSDSAKDGTPAPFQGSPSPATDGRFMTSSAAKASAAQLTGPATGVDMVVETSAMTESPMANETSKSPSESERPEPGAPETVRSAPSSASSARTNALESPDAATPGPTLTSTDVVSARQQDHLHRDAQTDRAVAFLSRNEHANQVVPSQAMPRHAGAIASSPPRQVTDHIVAARQSIHEGKARLEVMLDPPELGSIRIELTESGDALAAKLVATESSTLDALKSALPSMLDSLAAAGIEVDSLQLEGFGSGDRPDRRAESDTNGPLASPEPDDSPSRQFTSSPTRSGRVDIFI